MIAICNKYQCLEMQRQLVDQQECEKKFGVRYLDLLRLPYFNIVKYHIVDSMHNLLLGTAKYDHMEG